MIGAFTSALAVVILVNMLTSPDDDDGSRCVPKLFSSTLENMGTATTKGGAKSHTPLSRGNNDQMS
jgi:hypothetical protein